MTRGTAVCVFPGVRDIRDRLDALGEMPLPPYITRANPGELAADKIAVSNGLCGGGGLGGRADGGAAFHRGAAGGNSRARRAGLFCDAARGAGDVRAGEGRNARRATSCTRNDYEVTEETARAVNEAKQAGRRVIAVGTTTLRVLESVALQNERAIGCGRRDARGFSFIRRSHFKSWTRC